MTSPIMRDLNTDASAARELFRSLDGMEGLPDRPALAATGAVPWFARLQLVYPGLLMVGTIGLAASWLSQHYGAPVMLFALLIGMAFHFLHEDARCMPGIEFASKAVLRAGVALLGARITADQILGLGVFPIALVIAGIVTTVGLGLLAARRLRLSSSFGVLSGASVAICGASAALAVASVLPKTPRVERDTILTVVSVTALSTVAMIVYPLVVGVLGMNNVDAGIFFGGTIHDVAQVLGAGYTVSPEAGDIATYVKLLRVAMLIPVVFAIALVVSYRAGTGVRGLTQAPPLFLLGFAALVVINSIGLLPAAGVEGATAASRWCLVVAISALGMKTSFRDLTAVGWRPVALMVAETIWIALLVLGSVMLLR